MNKHNILFIALDTHKVSTEVANIEDQRGAKALHFDKVNTTKAAITQLAGAFNIKPNIHTRHCILFMKLVRVVVGFIACSQA